MTKATTMLSLALGVLSSTTMLLAQPVPCRGTELRDAESARERALTALETVIRFLDEDEQISEALVTWFGSDDPETAEAVTETFQASLSWAESFDFYCHYNNEGEFVDEIPTKDGEILRIDTSDSLFAYVYPSDFTKVYLGPAFHSSSPDGWDSQLGTVVHELTHYQLSGRTDDKEYGRSACQTLAKEDPSAALQNADSYQYFLEDWLGAD